VPGVRLLPADAIAATAVAARAAPRKRSNWNLHSSLEDPIQRFVNVFQPETYVRPHRHEPDRFELFVALAGLAGILVFSEEGAPTGIWLIGGSENRGIDIAGGVWHTVVGLAPDTVLFEVKPGPYRPLSDKDFAFWAPAEGTPEADAMVTRWGSLVSGSRG